MFQQFHISYLRERSNPLREALHAVEGNRRQEEEEGRHQDSRHHVTAHNTAQPHTNKAMNETKRPFSKSKVMTDICLEMVH